MAQSLLSTLNELDLTPHEAAIYLQLLKIGPSQAGPIIKALKIHRQFVYNSLNSLKEKGLVSEVRLRGKGLFSPSSPELLIQMAEQRLSLARALVPELNRISTSDHQGINIRVLSGLKDFYENLITVAQRAARSSRKIHIIGGGSDRFFYELIGPRYDDYREICKRFKITKELLCPQSSTESYHDRFLTEPRTELRVIKEGLVAPTYTRITDGLVTIEIYLNSSLNSKPDVTVVQIWNNEIAQSYHENFELLWRKARSIKSRAR